MWIDPTTHNIVFTMAGAGATLDCTVQYLVMNGVNVVRKDMVSFLLSPASAVTVSPTLAPGESWQVQMISLLAGLNSGFSCTRRTLGNQVQGQLFKGTLAGNEWAIYNATNGSFRKYDTNGNPYGILDGGGA